MRRIDAILIGAGQRGAESYAPYAKAHPERLRFVAVVDPDDARRTAFAQAHGIAEDRCFASAEPLFALGPIATAAFVCTPDNEHFLIAQRALEVGTCAGVGARRRRVAR